MSGPVRLHSTGHAPLDADLDVGGMQVWIIPLNLSANLSLNLVRVNEAALGTISRIKVENQVSHCTLRGWAAPLLARSFCHKALYRLGAVVALFLRLPMLSSAMVRL